MRRVLATLVLLVTLVAASGAEATYEGRNGRLVYGEVREERACYDGFGSHLISVLQDGGAKRKVTSGCYDELPSWSGDGATLAFVRESEIFVANAGGSGARHVVDPGSAAFYGPPALSPDATQVVFGTEDGISIAGFDGTRVASLSASGLDALPSWSRDGRKIVFRRDARLYTVNPDGSELHAMRPGSPYDRARSPDERLLVVRRDGRPFVRPVEGGEPRALVPEAFTVSDVVWSPDSRFLALLAFDTSEDDPIKSCGDCGAYYVVRADGGGLRRITPVTHEFLWAPAWQPLCTVRGTKGDDRLVGTRSGDVICGYGGADRIEGRGGADTIYGGDGNDVISGGPGRDVVFGGRGDDQLTIGDGETDSADGGPGRDVALRDRLDRMRLVERSQASGG